MRAARRTLEALFRAALAAVDPETLVRRALSEPRLDRLLARARRVGVFAVGKAAAGMFAGASSVVSDAPALIVLPRGYPPPPLRPGSAKTADVLFSSHPWPDRTSLAAARRALRFFTGFGASDLLVCLVSGGTSSLLCLPRSGLTLTGKTARIRRLARSGADIKELNRLRTALSAIKGGRLGRATPARLVTLVLSDVPGDDPHLVGSGPTVRGRRGDVVRVIGTNATGLAAAAVAARRMGLVPRVLRRRLDGDAAEVGRRLARRALALAPGEVLLAGGETTVRLDDAAGDARGGRSLELAAAAARSLAGSEAVLLACASDGRDGSSEVAGAFADGGSLDRARRAGLSIERSLARHDTASVFECLGDAFVTGPTGTNVCDWVFAISRAERDRRRPV